MQRLFFIFVLALCLVTGSNTLFAGDAAPKRFPSAPRIVAIGDLHGDIDATRRALKLAGAIDDNGRWIGGALVVVQTGDVLDRGDDEQAVLDLLSHLEKEAAQAGGAVHILNGNHELMNVKLDLRYVTPGGYEDFEDAVTVSDTDTSLAKYDKEQRARVAAFKPGGRYAKIMARHNTVIIIGQNVFVHGGLLPEHLDYGLERLNTELKAWMAGEGPIPEWTEEKDSPVWMRHYSDEVDGGDCELLNEVLDRLDAKRMIVGHTVHEKEITSYCEDKVWCIDVGMAAYYGGKISVLEIKGDDIRTITEQQ